MSDKPGMATKDANVSCELTGRDLELIRVQYNIPSDVVLELSEPSQRVNHFDRYRLALHRETLKIGIPFPFRGLVADFLRSFCIPTRQLTPNSWRILLVIERWAESQRVRLSRGALLKLLTIRRSGDFLAVQGIGNVKVVSGMPSSNKDWKPYFFFARRRDEGGNPLLWDVPVEWRDNLVLPRPGALTAEEGKGIQLLLETLRERALMYAAPREVPVRRSTSTSRPRLGVGAEPSVRLGKKARDPPPLSPTPLAALPPSSGGQPRPKKRRLVRRGDEGSMILAAKEESL